MTHANLHLASTLAELHYRLDAAIWRYLRVRLDDNNVFTQVAPSDWYTKNIEDSPFKVPLTYNLSVIHRDTGPNERTRMYLNRQLLRPMDFIQAVSEPVETEKHKRRVSKHYARELNRLSHIRFYELPASLQLLYVNQAMLDVIKLYVSPDGTYREPHMAEFIRCVKKA